MASGEGIPIEGVMSGPGERGNGSMENTRKIWGREQPMKPSFMSLNRGPHSRVGKSPDRVNQALL